MRFAIAAARVPDILLIDEALATGDAEFQRRSEQRIRELREDAATVFLVSHGLGIIRETCTRAIWLEKGKIIMDGPSDTVVDAYQREHGPQGRSASRNPNGGSGVARGVTSESVAR